jgi:lysophospholipase L1-like esterase
VSTGSSPLGRARGLLVALSLAGAFAAVAFTAAAAAKVPAGQPFVVRAIGDSVTAGFGYCGLADPSCPDGPGQPYALSEQSVCRGGDYDDRCSSNKGDYTAHLPGTDGVPAISWAAQFAVREDIPDFINYAVTGSRPDQWDDNTPPGFFNFHTLMQDVLDAHPDLTLMTLGANPVLHEFYSNPRAIACVALLSINQVKRCAIRELEKFGSKMHLEHIYERLLSVPTNHVIVLGYHTPHPAVHQVVLGKLIEFYLPRYAHVQAIIGEINSTVKQAVDAVAGQGDNRLRIHFVGMDPWPAEEHQCLDAAHEPWVISWDFCIHPTDAGYRQFVDRLVGFVREDPAAAGFEPGWVG